MASNVFSVNAYQINQRDPIPLVNVQTIGLPTTGVIARDVSGSPTRSLSTGVNVYSVAQVIATGDQFYCRETYAQLITLINA